MNRRFTVVLSVLALLLWVFAPAHAQVTPLNLGDPAPALRVKEFVKGTPVKSFETGKTYVVEFWATWCGPCIVSIPHVSDLAKKYPQVKFVGVSVWESDQSKVRPFVEKMGDKMAYNVAMDDVAPGANGNTGVMATTWMKAAAQNGIPAAFIVNGNGKVAWIGHPMQMDKPLAEIVAGKWDIDKAAADFKAEAEAERKVEALGAEMRAAGNDPVKRMAVLDKAIATDPSLEPQLGLSKFLMLRANGKNSEAAAYGRKYIANPEVAKSPMTLNQIAWGIVNPKMPPAMKPTPELSKLAVDAAKKADTVAQGKDGNIADTLALALYNTGDYKGALAAQERAVKLAKASGEGVDPELTQRLEMYRKAVAGGSVPKTSS